MARVLTLLMNSVEQGALKMKEISYIHAEVSSFSNHDECEVNLCY